MIANYHTHTWRCHHAGGTEREYVERAIDAGLEILGFSDHAPCIYPNGYQASYKMLPSELEDYVDTVLKLRDEYRGQIEIHLGFEAEFFPALWEDFLRLIEPYPIEYMILGQHFLENEYDARIYCGNRSLLKERLHRYCEQCMEGLDTGRFLYFAHPDLFHFAGDEEFYEKEMTALCRFCKERGIPLEMNLLGIREERQYPRPQFWEIAAREGNLVILGADAHQAEHVYVPEAVEKAERMLERCGISGERVLDGRGLL